MNAPEPIRDASQRERLARAIAMDLVLYHEPRIKGASSVEEALGRIAAELEEGRTLYTERTGDLGTRVDAALAALLPGYLSMKEPTVGRLGVHDASTSKVGIWVWLLAMSVLGLGLWLWRR